MFDIAIKNVSFAYGDNKVLSDLSLTVAAGDFVAIVGPNGAGKSTILKLIAGLVRPADGVVQVGGKVVRDACYSCEIGYVPQHYANNTAGFPATVEEIVALGLTSSGSKRVKREGARHIVKHMLDLVGLEGLNHRLVGELSGGQQQRVMVARALAANPGLLLLDEPTSGVDYETGTKLYGLLGEINRNLGITIVAVSHDIDKVTRFANKVACINNGLCFYGDSTEFRHNHAGAPHFFPYQKV
ncbi:MAG: Sulfate-transporting ATPase [Firmicutes bacterium]|nr:Sulfate-transporting ATPase [Bacillota bacterium]